MKVTIEIVQYESGGIPDEPEVFLNEKSAFRKFQELVVEQGFRKRTKNETLADYCNQYYDSLDRDPETMEQEKNNLPDPDDTVRWWTKEIRVR